MRVAFVTGPVASGRCGVGDYTRLLAGALERRGIHTAVFEAPGSASLRAFRLHKTSAAFRPDVVHLQYPTAGFGRGLTAQIYSLLSRFVLTLHEVEDTHLLRRIALYPLWARSRHVIFTCESNRQYSVRWAPWLHGASSVIPLASNIPVATGLVERRESQEVVHFGLVRPNKGIEHVLEFARLACAQRFPVTVRIIGGCPPEHADYVAGLRTTSASLPVIWDLNLSADQVAERLARAALAYLPFPDGASERHASLLAALANGVPVLTTRGRFTPTDLEQAVEFCATPVEALEFVKYLRRRPDTHEGLCAKAKQIIGKRSWEAVADAHIGIYQRVMGLIAGNDLAARQVRFSAGQLGR